MEAVRLHSNTCSLINPRPLSMCKSMHRYLPHSRSANWSVLSITRHRSAFSTFRSLKAKCAGAPETSTTCLISAASCTPTTRTRLSAPTLKMITKARVPQLQRTMRGCPQGVSSSEIHRIPSSLLPLTVNFPHKTQLRRRLLKRVATRGTFLP